MKKFYLTVLMILLKRLIWLTNQLPYGAIRSKIVNLIAGIVAIVTK